MQNDTSNAATHQDVPRANRTYITLFGRRNSGKSSLINAFTAQQTSIVSDVPGTTTDTVQKNMEIAGVGACVLMDTPGFDDDGELGAQRVEQARKAVSRTNLAILVVSIAQLGADKLHEELRWMQYLRQHNVPTIVVLSQVDRIEPTTHQIDFVQQRLGNPPLLLSSHQNRGFDELKKAIAEALSLRDEITDITGNLCHEEDLVLLVMPQDIQAPKGRLILPQVQTLRNLLDKKCIAMSCTTDKLPQTLRLLAKPPALIITDSQAFGQVAPLCPKETKLTSFSILFAHYKGNIDKFIEGAQTIGQLTEHSKVLIAEACTHVPLGEDIGRVQLPRKLRQIVGETLRIDNVSGNDFPDDLSSYDLVIHCGACMFTRKHVLARLQKADSQTIPMTNYGVALAYLGGLLDKVAIPTL